MWRVERSIQQDLSQIWFFLFVYLSRVHMVDGAWGLGTISLSQTYLVVVIRSFGSADLCFTLADGFWSCSRKAKGLASSVSTLYSGGCVDTGFRWLCVCSFRDMLEQCHLLKLFLRLYQLPSLYLFLFAHLARICFATMLASSSELLRFHFSVHFSCLQRNVTTKCRLDRSRFSVSEPDIGV